MPLLPASDHPPTSFPVATFRIVFSATPCPGDQPTPYFELSSLLHPPRHPQARSSQTPQNYSTGVVANCLVIKNPGPPAATYLSLGFLSPGTTWLSGARATSSPCWPRGSPGGARPAAPEDANQLGAGQSSKRRRSCSKMHGVKPWAMEATVILAKNLKQTLLDLRAPGSAGAQLPPGLPGEPLPGGAGETHQEMASPWGACAGWPPAGRAGEHLLQGLPLQHHEEPPQPSGP